MVKNANDCVELALILVDSLISKRTSSRGTSQIAS